MTHEGQAEGSLQAATCADSHAALRRDLQCWKTSRTLRDGTRVCIRPLWRDDRGREIVFIESLSEQTRYFRMMAPLRYLSKHLLEQLMNVDYSQSMAFAATIGEGDAERFVGLARYGKTDQPDTVELAITVTDQWQRHGIARELIEHLVRFATAQGYRRMIGWVLYDNHRMLKLARACGFKIRIAPEHGALEIVRNLEEVWTSP